MMSETWALAPQPVSLVPLGSDVTRGLRLRPPLPRRCLPLASRPPAMRLGSIWGSKHPNIHPVSGLENQNIYKVSGFDFRCSAEDVPVDVKGLPWTGIENSLNSPSNGPLLLQLRWGRRTVISWEVFGSVILDQLFWIIFGDKTPWTPSFSLSKLSFWLS